MILKGTLTWNLGHWAAPAPIQQISKIMGRIHNTRITVGTGRSTFITWRYLTTMTHSTLQNNFKVILLALVIQASTLGVTCQARPQAAQAHYSAMAPLGQYLMSDESAEIALARSAAPASISHGAEVMVLGRRGYFTAVKGRNGFLCMVQRSWDAAANDPVFWNPKIRGPICFSPQAVRTYLPIYLMKTKLVLAGKSKTAILEVIASMLDKKELPLPAAGAMCYMMSKQQYLGDGAGRWHPHLMFFAPGDAKSWGANLPGSPVMAANYPKERMTIFMVRVDKWSDGTPTSSIVH